MRLSPASISCVHLVRPSRASISYVHLVRPSCASISCVYLLRLSLASNSCVYLVRLCCCVLLIRPPYTPLSMLNVLTPLTLLTPLSVSFRLSCSSCSYNPLSNSSVPSIPIIRAFDSYNYLSNSSVSIGSIRLPPHALRRVKINFFKRREKPERFEVFNSVELFGVYGVFKGVRRVRGLS